MCYHLLPGRLGALYTYRTSGTLKDAFSKDNSHHNALDLDQRIACRDWLTCTRLSGYSALGELCSGSGAALIVIGVLVVPTRDKEFSRLGLPAMMLLVAWGVAWVVASLAHGLGGRDRAYL